MTGKEDTKAWFSQAIGQNMDSLYGLAVRLTRNKAEAEDLVAESITKAWSAIGTLTDRQRFRQWLFRILNNCFISDYRKKSVRPSELAYDELAIAQGQDEISELMILQPDEFMHWWANPEKEFINRLLGEDIMTAIDGLPEVFKTSILLVSVEGFTYDDAARILNVAPGTVRSRMKRGRTLLQKALWQHAKDQGFINDDANKA
jgi:RNA polymerase sigma-70 factor (ECF subfamily)